MNAPTRATRLAVIGTAGHIDHGKTALVRRLTGVDTDRLPEEKRRGISIDLGFAPLVTPAGVRIGIVDVPGHERFVKNMLAGVGGIDLVLLVIAADEGVMPQTREHLAIVQLLGVERGIVALTKRDLVDREWVELVARDVRALLAGTALAEAPLVECSAATGEGIDRLLAEIDRQLQDLAPRSDDDPARLPVDRVFTVEGFGTVVTGTLWRGTVRVGDALELLPAGAPVRVRRVQVHGETVPAALAGQRTAVAIHGVDRASVQRGDWLVAPGSLPVTRVLDARFELLPDYPRPWPAQRRVRFHLGAAERIGRLMLLEGRSLAPGESALAQIRLERPTAAARGDRFVVRSYSPSRTVGGGTVIQPVATRRRRAPELADLRVHEHGSPEARVLQKLGEAARPVALVALAQDLGEREAGLAETLAGLRGQGRVVELAGRWLDAGRWSDARAAIAGAVAAYAEKYPARFGVPKGELKSGLGKRLDAALHDAAFESLVAEHALEVRSDRVRPAGRPWEPPAATLEGLDALVAQLEGAGFSVPEQAAWEARLGPRATEVVALGVFLGRLVRVSQELTYTAAQLERLRGLLAAHLAKHPSLTVADFKDLAGVSRKYAVPLLEHGDRAGWTVRSGDVRKPGARLAAGPQPPH